MKFDVRWLDVRTNLLTEQQPVYMLERPLLRGSDSKGGVFNVAEVARAGTFWVPQTPVVAEQVSWVMTEIEQWVRVPIHAYRTNERALASIWGLGIQIGMASIESLRCYTQEIPLVATLVLGHEVTDMLSDTNAFRCYIGVAIQVSKR